MLFKNYSLMLLAVLLVACGGNQETHEVSAEYPLMCVSRSTIKTTESYPATIQGRQVVELYPQVSGTISKLLVKEGDRVKQGQVLFIIDQVPCQAALRTATANVNAAQAQVDVAQLDYNSKVILFNEEVISEYDLAMAKKKLTIAKAGLKQAKAQETNARNDLSHTEVKSPCNGVVGTLPYRAGALVGPSIAQPLTTVSDTEQMYVYFSLTEREVISRMQQRGGSFDKVAEAFPPVFIKMANGANYSLQGMVESISGVVDKSTGALSARAVFPNPDGILLTGSTGRLIVPQTQKNVIVIPQTATYKIMNKTYAYKVVDGVAHAAIISVQPLSDRVNYIVVSGLNDGDVIISEGAGYVKEGMKIQPKQK